MDSKNAFERQIAAEIDYEVGPPHPVDALAITRTAKTHNPRWRIRSMLSPVQAITAGAMALAIGGVLLVAQPFEREGGGSPGAVTEAVAPTWVTGAIQPVDGSCSSGDSSSTGGVSRWHYECATTWTSSDPRLTGDVLEPWIEDTFQTDEGHASVGIDASYLQTDVGDWVCSFVYVTKGSTPTEPTSDMTLTCTGSGEYEGLTAVLVATPTEGFAAEFAGLIFAGDLPPVPEPPAAE